MKSRATLPAVRQAVLSPESDLWRHAAVRPSGDHEALLTEHQVPSLNGHDFSRVPVFAGSPYGEGDKVACPLSPRRCPFGGACDTCPVQVQAKPVVNQPGDEYEQEAERMAEQVIRSAGPPVQGRAGGVMTPRVVPQVVHDVLRSPGQPLPSSSRAFFEPRFGHDLSHVRIHSGAEAGRLARSVQAKAFTVGHDVVFGEGRYQPGSPTGQRLMAHELVHVLQQRSAARIQRLPDAPAGGLSDAMLEQIARRLREAMAGWGTDEDAIYAAFSGRTQAQVDAIVRVYRQLYRRELIDDLRGELNESELRRLAVFAPRFPAGAPQAATASEQQTLAEAAAERLDRAMRGWGTDEASIFATLTGRTPAERQAIKDAYRRRTQRQLEADLRDELSGGDLTEALMLLNQGLLAPEDEIYLAIRGAGTDEDTIFRVLGSLRGNAAGLRSLEAAYQRKYGDLVADLRSDLTADEYARAREIISPAILDADVQDCGTGNPAQTTRSVREAHARAVEMLRAARGRLVNSTDPAVQAAAQRYFKITLPATADRDRRNWAHVRRALETMAVAETEAVYECEPQQRFIHGFCIPNNIGVTILNIHLCPAWWTSYTNLDRRAAVLIHEWGHRFGTGVAKIFETYCFATGYAPASAENLITWPDAYMQFVWDLSIGAPAPCF